MKKIVFLALAAVAAPAPWLAAEDTGFDSLYGGVAGLSAAPAAAPVPAVPRLQAPAVAAERDWLIMVFVNGRNNLWPAAVRDVNEMETVGSTGKVAVTVEMGLINDRGVSTRFLVQKDTRFPVSDLVSGDSDPSRIISGGIRVPDSDMGSWRHFADFAKWSIRKYPAKKLMAVIWGHGYGRLEIYGADNSGAELGIASDDTTKNFIRNKQISMALSEITRSTGRKVDVYASDACLMQMASVVYELKDRAGVVVGSEEIVPGAGFPYHLILPALNADPDADAEGLGRIVVEKFSGFYDANKARLLGGRQGTAISAIRTSQLGGFVRVLGDWTAQAGKQENMPVLKAAASKTLTFEYGNPGPDSGFSARSKDLYDFIARVNADPGTPGVLKARGRSVQSFITDRLVVAHAVTGPNGGYVRAKGLAVYFPQMIYDQSYDETRFAVDGTWDDFIKFMLAEEQR